MILRLQQKCGYEFNVIEYQVGRKGFKKKITNQLEDRQSSAMCLYRSTGNYIGNERTSCQLEDSLLAVENENSNQG